MTAYERELIILFPPASGGPGGFKPSDPNDIFAQLFGQMGGGGGAGMFGDSDPFGGRSRRAGAGAGGMPGGFASMFGGGMPGGMGGMGGMGMDDDPTSGPAAKDTEKELPISLEDLYAGTTKKLKVGKRRADGTTEENVLQIDVKRGWKKGTKVRFAGSGNEIAPGKSSDLVFIIAEKPHPRFSREGDDLHIKLPLPLVDALDPPKTSAPGGKRVVQTLDGRSIDVPIPQPTAGKTTVAAGRTTRLANEGMPISKTGGSRKGDLIVTWELQIPDRLSDSQRQAVRKALS